MCIHLLTIQIHLQTVYIHNDNILHYIIADACGETARRSEIHIQLHADKYTNTGSDARRACSYKYTFIVHGL